MLVLHTQRNLRQAFVDQVAEQPYLDAEHVLTEVIVRQAEPVLQVADIETLMRIGKLHAIAIGDRQACHIKVVVRQIHVRGEGGSTPLALLAVAGDHRPRGYAAAGAPFNAGRAARGDQPAVVAQSGRRSNARHTHQQRP